MNIKQHIRMTASEIAMGRYMRAPDHPVEEDEFSKAFDAEVLTGEPQGGGDGAGAATDAGGEGAAAAAADGGGAAGGDAGAGSAAPAGTDAGAGAAPAPEAGAEAGAAADAKGDKADGGGAGGDAGGATGGDASAAPAAADAGVSGAAPAKPAAVPGADGVDAEAILDRLAAAVAAKAPAPAPAPKPEEAEALPPIFDEKEQSALNKFKEDWPAEYEAMNLMQRELGVGVIRHVFDALSPVMREMKDTVDALAQRAMIKDVAGELQEYPSDQEIDQIREWVKTQPSYLQAGMNSVIEGGTAEDVVDLVSRYREATGKKPAPAQVPDPKPQGGDTELSGVAKQAAKALAPVGTKRSAVQSPDDTSDFDANWDKYVNLEV